MASQIWWQVLRRSDSWWISSTQLKMNRATSFWAAKREPRRRSTSTSTATSWTSDSSSSSWRNLGFMNNRTKLTIGCTDTISKATAYRSVSEDAALLISGKSVWRKLPTDWRSRSNLKTIWYQKSLSTFSESSRHF
jgi:hypothetical protein